MRECTPLHPDADKLLNTRLSGEKMKDLANRSLANMRERMQHDYVHYSAMDLFMLLPARIYIDGVMYIPNIYITAFDVPGIRYNSPHTCKCLVQDNFIVEKDNSIADAIYNLLIYIDDNYPEELVDIKKEIANA